MRNDGVCFFVDNPAIRLDISIHKGLVQTLDQLRLEGVDVGSDIFLQKPCRRQDLLSRLRELL